MPENENMSPEQIAEFQKQNCIFCKMGSGEMQARTVHSDEETFAVLDINPAAKGHMLLIPKEHYAVMPQMPPPLISSLFKTARQLSQTAFKSFKCKGTTILASNGASAGQKAPHFMIHIIPRNTGDGLHLESPAGQQNPEDLKDAADKIREFLGTEKPETQKPGEEKTDPETEQKSPEKQTADKKEFDLDKISKMFEGGQNA